MRTETLVYMWQDYSGSLSSLQDSLDHISARLSHIELRLLVAPGSLWYLRATTK